MRLSLTILCLLVPLCAAQDLKITEADRTIDVSSQLVKTNVAFTVSNGGKSEIGEVTFLVTEKEQEHLAYIIALVDKKEIKPKKAAKSPAGFSAFTIELSKKIAAGSAQKINVDYVLTQALRPFPAEITQDEIQHVVYTGNGYISSSYDIAEQKTTIVVGGGKVLSSTALTPNKQVGEKLIYGPYTAQKALVQSEVKVHYENNSPFIVARTIDRVIEISHWGNIAVEEKIQLVHAGAKLTGPFSRLDYQLDRRGKKQPCVKDFKTILPASARDIYYRDVIGNISSSSVKVRADSVEVDIKPRFPLFGGWKTNYVIGYNLPSYEYLHADGNRFLLKMRLLDHVYDNMVVERLTTRIVLPELASDVKLITPYDVNRQSDEQHATYLDWGEGRTVVVLHKDSLVDAHIQPFVLKYNWQRTFLWREPIMASAFFFCLFLAVIVYVRFDFEITKNEQEESLLKASAKLDKYSNLVRERLALYLRVFSAYAAYKEDRNEGALDSAKAKVKANREELKKKLDELREEIKKDSPEVYEKLGDIENIESKFYGSEKTHADKSKGSASKNSPEDKAWSTEIQETKNRINKILDNF